MAPEPLEIPDSTHVPEVTLLSAWNLLRHHTRTASGPDEIPYWLWRDYADYLAPIITNIFNSSVGNGGTRTFLDFTHLSVVSVKI